MSLLGHSALVTGASRGLGQAIAICLAEHGCSVTLLARNKSLLKSTLQLLPINHHLQSHQFIDYDLADLSDSQTIDPRIESALLKCSILINNAGVTNHSLLYNLPTDEISSTIRTNLLSPILLTKLAYRPMMKTSLKMAKQGLVRPVIVNISSILSFTTLATSGTSVYAATKAGLLGFTTALAVEMRGKVRINSILPGLIPETHMGANASVPGASPVSLKDVSNSVLKVIQEDEVNGECIIVDNDGTKFYRE